MMLHENTRLVIVSAESFYTIHITQRNFGLPVRKNDKIVAPVERIFSAGRILTSIRSGLSSDMLEKLLIISLNK